MKTNRTFPLLGFVFLCSLGYGHAAGDKETFKEIPAEGKVIRKIEWSKVGKPGEGSLTHDAPGDEEALLIRHSDDKPSSVPLLLLENPNITANCYAFRGKIRCQKVEGNGYVETWNEFPAEAPGQAKVRAFSRTLAEEGPMRKLAGTQAWRDLFVPFNATDAQKFVSRIELDLFLPGSGTVEITDLELVEYPTAQAMLAAMVVDMAPSWFSVSSFVLGAISAAVALAGLAGTLLWWRSRQRHAAEVRRMKALDLP